MERDKQAVGFGAISMERIDLLSYINWNTSYSAAEVLRLIDDKDDNSTLRLNFFVKSL
ncbi:MAG: hypothetical protein IKA80_08695 [Spirochaetaceae bacterium]|nr:hypothetical protein [Spirochaetaceae bacterium]